MKKSIKENQ